MNARTIEINIIKKGKYITTSHTISVGHLSDDQIDSLSKMIYDYAKMLTLNVRLSEEEEGEEKEEEKK